MGSRPQQYLHTYMFSTHHIEITYLKLLFLKSLKSCSLVSRILSLSLLSPHIVYIIQTPNVFPNSVYHQDPCYLWTKCISSRLPLQHMMIPIFFLYSVYDNKNSGVSLFFQRQFWVAWKLLSSTLMWHKVLSDSVIHDLAVRSLLNLYLLPALNLAVEINPSDALDKCRNVRNLVF